MSWTSQPTHDYDHHRGSRPLLRETGSLRGVLFVGASLLEFVVLNAFMFHVASGRWLDFSISGYRRSLGTPLGEIFLHPLSIFSHPWMIVVTGMLVAGVVFVPIMVAVLYRLWVSALFVAAVVVMGHSPLLAGCLAVGCVVAGRTGLRSNLPFLAMLSGLGAATGVYLLLRYVLLPGGADQGLPSLRGAVLYLPLILGLVLVVVCGAAALALAKWTRYRPGVIWPVLLAMAAAPVAVFYGMVGPAELDYALIAAELAPADALFVAIDETTTPGVAGAQPGKAGPAVSPGGQAALEQRRQRLMAACEQFLRRYPRSPRAPAVKWIHATAVDVRMLGSGRGARWAYVGPSIQSLGLWRELAERYPESPQSLVAQHRLGIVAVRQERLAKAIEHLRTAQQRLVQHLAAQRQQADRRWRGAFAPAESLPGLEYFRRELAEVDETIWLIEANWRPDGGDADLRALAEYMKLRPFREVDAEELGALAVALASTTMADNFRLAATMAEPDPTTRAERLAELAEGVSESAITANYELGLLAMRTQQTEAWRQAGLKTAADYFKVVVTSPANPYIEPAGKRLAWLTGRPAPRAETRPAHVHD